MCFRLELTCAPWPLRRYYVALANSNVAPMLAMLLNDANPEYIERAVKCLVLLAATLGPMARKIAADSEFMGPIWEIIKKRRGEGEEPIPTEEQLAAAAAAAAEAAAAAAAAAAPPAKGAKAAAEKKDPKKEAKDAPPAEAPPPEEPVEPPPPPPPEEVVRCLYPPVIVEGALRVRPPRPASTPPGLAATPVLPPPLPSLLCSLYPVPRS